MFRNESDCGAAVDEQVFMFDLTLKLNADANGYLQFEIPAKEAQLLLADGNKRITVTLPDGHIAHLSVATPKTGGYRVQFSKELARKRMLSDGMELELQLAVDESPHQFAVPEEVQFLLDTDEAFEEAFFAMRPGARRSLLFWAGYSTNEIERAERATHLMEMVVAGQPSADVIRKSFRRSDLAAEKRQSIRKKSGWQE